MLCWALPPESRAALVVTGVSNLVGHKRSKKWPLPEGSMLLDEKNLRSMRRTSFNSKDLWDTGPPERQVIDAFPSLIVTVAPSSHLCSFLLYPCPAFWTRLPSSEQSLCWHAINLPSWPLPPHSSPLSWRISSQLQGWGYKEETSLPNATVMVNVWIRNCCVLPQRNVKSIHIKITISSGQKGKLKHKHFKVFNPRMI